VLSLQKGDSSPKLESLFLVSSCHCFGARCITCLVCWELQVLATSCQVQFDSDGSLDSGL